MYVKKAAEKTFVQKMCMFNVDEIDGRCQFHQHMHSAFLCKQDENLFSVHKLGKWLTLFSKNCANLSLKFGVLRIGEIEQQIFLFIGYFSRQQKKIGEIDPRSKSDLSPSSRVSHR